MSSMLNSRATGNRSPKNTGYDLISTMSPETASMSQQLMGKSMGGMDNILSQLMQMASGDNESYWKQMEAPAMRQFEKFQGSAANRFSGLGMGARHSSGFQNALSEGAVDLSERLQSNRMDLRQQAIESLMRIYQQLMQNNPHEEFLMEKEGKGLNWGGALKGASSGATAGSALGPWGAAGGGLIGGTLGLFAR